MNEQKEKYEILVMAILLAGACFLTYYFHAVLNTGTVFTHFFYIPIILASLWWRRKGLVVAIFLAALILFSHVFVREVVVTANDYLRVLMFIVIAFVVATLSEWIAKAQDALRRSSEELELKVEERTKDLAKEREALKREKNFSANVIATVPDSLLVLDANLRIKSVNRSFYEKFQTEPDEVIGSDIAEVLGDKDGKLSAALTKQFGTEARDMLENFELHYQSEKLGERIFNITARGMLIAEEEEEEEELVVLKDITERKRVEEALRESEEKYREVVKTSVDGVISLDSQMKVGVWNKGAERLFGYTEEEMLGQSLMKIVPERYRKAMEKGFVEFRKSGSGPVIGKTLEFEGVRKDGTEIPVELSVSSRKVGETYIATAIVRDITERKRAEEMLRESHEKLKELDKMKTDFLAVAYHEMRTPLAPIVGYTNLLEQGELNEKQKKYVRIIEESASQLGELIESLLEVTRLEAGKVELTLESVSIPEIVDNVLERVKPQADAKKQTISTAVPEGIEVEGDKQKITAIFDNLISNAIKYTDEKGRIDIVAEDRKKEEDIRVCVANTGVGIPEEHLPMVFERFYRVDTSLTRKGGLGLGLAIVKGYVELHGGRVWVTSELEKGSKFWFTLPKRQNVTP